MTHFNHITAKGMPSMAGQRAPMLMSVGIGFGGRLSLRRALECSKAFIGDSARMFGFSNIASLGYAVDKASNCTTAGFAYVNPRHRYDNSPGKARIKLR
jgi:hypothetical protein